MVNLCITKCHWLLPLNCDTGLEARPFGGGDKKNQTNKKQQNISTKVVSVMQKFSKIKTFENYEDVNSILVRTIRSLIN